MPRAVTLEQLGNALKRADEAGDTKAARRLAREIKRRRAVAARQRHPELGEAEATEHVARKRGPELLKPASPEQRREALRNIQREALPAIAAAGTAFTTGAIEGIPVVGPALRRGAEAGAATFGSLLTGQPRQEVRREMGELVQRRQAEQPGTATAGRVAGTFGTLMRLPQAAFATAPKAAVTGSAISGADVTGRRLTEAGELPTAAGILTAMGLGGAGAAGGVLIGRGIARLWDRVGTRLGQTPPLTLDRQARAAQKAVTNRVKAASQRMDDAAVVIDGRAIDRMVSRIDRQMREAGISKDTTPQAWDALQTLRERLTGRASMSLREINTVRTEDIRGSLNYATAKGREIRLVTKMVDEISRSINTLAPGRSVVSGDVQKGVSAWREMNAAVQLSKRAEIIAGRIESAIIKSESSGQPVSRHLQAEFRSLLTTQSGRKLLAREGFTQADRDAFRSLAEGTFTMKALNHIDRAFSIVPAGRWIAALVARPGFEAGATGAATERATAVMQRFAPMPGRPALGTDLEMLGGVTGTAGGQTLGGVLGLGPRERDAMP